jgi:hypothetical protein
MRQRFVPLSYQCDLHKKLQLLDQGDMSTEDYYAELQKGMIRAGVHEETEDKIYRFMGSCELKFRILLTINNTILLIICSSLLCWQRRNYRADNRQERRAHSRLITHRRHLQLRVRLLQLIFRRHLRLHVRLPY